MYQYLFIFIWLEKIEILCWTWIKVRTLLSDWCDNNYKVDRIKLLQIQYTNWFYFMYHIHAGAVTLLIPLCSTFHYDLYQDSDTGLQKKRCITYFHLSEFIKLIPIITINSCFIKEDCVCLLLKEGATGREMNEWYASAS